MRIRLISTPYASYKWHSDTMNGLYLCGIYKSDDCAIEQSIAIEFVSMLGDVISVWTASVVSRDCANLCIAYKFALSMRDCMNSWWHWYYVEYIKNVNIPVSTISTNTFSYCISTNLQGTILHNIIRKLDCQAIFVLSLSLRYHEHTIVFIAV